jgi:hypothetical protein
MSISLLKREIEAEISNLEARKKLKKNNVDEEKRKRQDKRKKKAPITQTNIKFKLCNVDYKKEKDFTKEGLEMLGRCLLFTEVL